jgi:hypothetical protein
MLFFFHRSISGDYLEAFTVAFAFAVFAIFIFAAAVAAVSVFFIVIAFIAGDETRPATYSENCPVEPLRESVASMEALLQEWFEGLRRLPYVRELKARFGCRWRYTFALRQRFYVRRKLIR